MIKTSLKRVFLYLLSCFLTKHNFFAKPRFFKNVSDLKSEHTDVAPGVILAKTVTSVVFAFRCKNATDIYIS